MDYTPEIMDLYSHTIGLEPRKYQVNIMNKLLNNVYEGKKMQSVKMPNMAGKTIMINFLAVLFKYQGIKAIIYSGEKIAASNPKEWKKKHYFYHQLNDVYDDYFKSQHRDILVADPYCFSYLDPDDVDVIITDCIECMIDESIDLRYPEKYLSSNIDYAKQSEGVSSQELALWSISMIRQLVQKKDSISIISFEEGRTSLDNGYTPIIATDYVTCFGIADFDLNKLDSIEREYLMTYDQLQHIKIENRIRAEKNLISKEEAIKNDEAIQGDTEDIASVLKIIEKRLSALEKQNSDNGIKTILTRVEGKVNVIDDKIDEISNNTAYILSIINDAVTSRKKFMDMYYDVYSENDEKLDLMISKFSTAIANEIVEKNSIISKNNDYCRMEKTLQLRLGDDCWKKMSAESKSFLITAKFTLINQMMLGDLMDYSGVCVLASKAFETELAKRLIEGYQEYIKSDLRLGKDYRQKWPGSLLKMYKGQIMPKTIEDFTLGDCKGIMNIRIEREDYRRNNNDLFIKYCRDRLLKIKDEKEIKTKLLKYDKMIEHVRVTFRNPASHKSPISLTLAKDCIDYIIEVEHVLSILLSDFVF